MKNSRQTANAPRRCFSSLFMGASASKPSRNAPIGVFDSGLGGLTIVREIRRSLPSESIVYFGDIARLPYGTKSREQIKRFSDENARFLAARGIKALVIACNSSSSAAFRYLKSRFDFPVIDVISPAVGEALRGTRTGRIGVIGTSATIESGAYERALHSKKKGLKVFSISCPLFVPIVEEGMFREAVAHEMIRYYLKPLQKQRVDTLILGCTHYPLMKAALSRFFGSGVQLIDSASPSVRNLGEVLEKSGLRARRRISGRLRLYVSDLPRNFIRVGEAFLKERLTHLQVVRQA